MRILPWLALALFGATGTSSAATVLVTNLGDAPGACPSASACTLRAAILAANADDRIEFDPALPFPATLTLVGSELALDKILIIEDLTLAGGNIVGTFGTSAVNGTGAGGQSGGTALGGCIRANNGTQLVLERVAVATCTARGGGGGNGGSGANASNSAGDGGTGGSGGGASGGAIYSTGQLSLIDSSISGSQALGGDAGDGGDGGNASLSGPGDGGTGGAGGTARGGAIFVGGPGSLVVRNSSLIANLAVGGDGGNGGDGGGGPSTDGGGGTGGAGGAARGGQVHIATNTVIADFEFVTLGPSGSDGGPGGNRGVGDPDGQIGLGGSVDGELLFALEAPRVLSSAFVGGFGDGDCAGSAFPVALGTNLDSDGSCNGFSGSINYGNFVGPSPFVEGGRTLLLPRANSPTVDAADDCLDLDATPLATDQSGRARPQDGNGDDIEACDVGAIEFSLTVFRDGFEP
jgi:CSLREA domain-containing protein